jgi:hypothetical protein
MSSNKSGTSSGASLKRDDDHDDDVDKKPPPISPKDSIESSPTPNAISSPPDEENQNQQQQGGETCVVGVTPGEGNNVELEQSTLALAEAPLIEAHLVEDDEARTRNSTRTGSSERAGSSASSGGSGGGGDIIYYATEVIETPELRWWKQKQIKGLLSIILTLLISMAFLLAIFLHRTASPPSSSAEISTSESSCEETLPSTDVSFLLLYLYRILRR